jgi:hypothetical protein
VLYPWLEAERLMADMDVSHLSWGGCSVGGGGNAAAKSVAVEVASLVGVAVALVVAVVVAVAMAVAVARAISVVSAMMVVVVPAPTL